MLHAPTTEHANADRAKLKTPAVRPPFDFPRLRRSGGPVLPLRPSQSLALPRQCACGGSSVPYRECAECKAKREASLQRQESGPTPANVAPPIVHDVLRSPGQPLDPRTRAFLEPRFGQDFSRVRVHTDAKAANSAQAVGALAYTVGGNIVFDAGRYAPGTGAGKRLLAHELTHVVQQGATLRRAPDALPISEPSDASEQEANASAEAVMCGTAAYASQSDGAALRREPADAGTSADGKVVSPTATGAQPVNCGPGTANPFCLPIPAPDAPCKPFASVNQAEAAWNSLSVQIPSGAAAATRCGEVKAVWDTYFATTSTPFAFSDPASCVVSAAKTDPEGSAAANRAAVGTFQAVVDSLPVTLRSVTPFPFSLGGPLAVLRLPLEDAVGPHGPLFLHPNIIYNNPFNAAANIAGAVGRDGEGSDIFGDDDRIISGTVIIEVNAIDPTSGIMTGQVRWQPHIHVKDTVDFCPGNLGNSLQRPLTLPMSKLEAMGMTRDVPITIDYDLDLQQANFNVQPLIGPVPPAPGPKPPTPPGLVSAFPRSGPAKTTGSLLRIRTGPGLHFPALGELGDRGTPLQIITQVHGDPVDGNDVWDQIDGGFVSDRFVAFDAGP